MSAVRTGTSNFHYARMRLAEQAARSLSVRNSIEDFLGIQPTADIAKTVAVRDSYYLLAAAYRSAGRRTERRERRTQAWADFRTRPGAYTRCTLRGWASSIRHTMKAGV